MLCVQDWQQAFEIMQLMPLLLRAGKYLAHVLWISILVVLPVLPTKWMNSSQWQGPVHMEEATDFSPKLLMISTKHLKVPLANIYKENIQGWLQSCSENGKQLEQGGNTVLQPLPKLLLQRYHNSLHFRPEAQWMKTYCLVNCVAPVSFLVGNRSQVSGTPFTCLSKTAHYYWLSNMTI